MHSEQNMCAHEVSTGVSNWPLTMIKGLMQLNTRNTDRIQADAAKRRVILLRNRGLR